MFSAIYRSTFFGIFKVNNRMLKSNLFFGVLITSYLAAILMLYASILNDFISRSSCDLVRLFIIFHHVQTYIIRHYNFVKFYSWGASSFFFLAVLGKIYYIIIF